MSTDFKNFKKDINLFSQISSQRVSDLQNCFWFSLCSREWDWSFVIGFQDKPIFQITAQVLFYFGYVLGLLWHRPTKIFKEEVHWSWNRSWNSDDLHDNPRLSIFLRQSNHQRSNRGWSLLSDHWDHGSDSGKFDYGGHQQSHRVYQIKKEEVF